MKLRRHRKVLALLLVVAVTLGTACRAATLSQPAVECSSLYPGNAKATFNWIPVTPNGVVQYLDLSLSDNGFAPGTFVSVGPLSGDASTYVWDGLVQGTVHVFRVNTFDGSNWWPSTTGYFTTPWCSVPPPGGGGGCIESSIKGEFTGWNGDTLFPLSNGQFWLQASMSLLLHLALSPRVTICPVDGGYRMSVEGVSKTILVTPVSCIESSIDGLFDGWHGDTLFKLSNGQFWQQAYPSYLYHYAYYPRVIICPVDGLHKMWVEGVDESMFVRPLTCMETCIDGSFEGFDYGAVFNLCNGHVWRQTSASYRFHYAYRPSVTICEMGGTNEMWVEGIDESVNVVRLR